MSSFMVINWAPSELISKQKANSMSENSDWLFKNTPRAVYTLGATTRAEGIKIASGRVLIAKNNQSDDGRATVRFGNFFSARCQPIITTGIVSDARTQIFCVVSGISQLQPDNQGFRVAVNIASANKKNDKIGKSFYVSWQAMGY